MRRFGIVGSRNAKADILSISRQIANVFARNSINVISGIARGVDKFAHLGALDVKGKTVAVLGSRN
jgi:DNA processing protein